MENLSHQWDAFLAYLNTAPPGWIYFSLFFVAFLENVTPPIPGDTIIVFGAYLAGINVINIWSAYLWMWAGSAGGCLAVYAVAYWKGREYFLRLESRFFDESKLEVAEAFFQRHGMKIVVFNRFVPTFRSLVGLVAGISRLPPLQMTIYVLVSTFLWNSILVYFGLKVGENWQLVTTMLQVYNKAVMSFVIGVVVLYTVWRIYRRSKERRSEGQNAA